MLIQKYISYRVAIASNEYCTLVVMYLQSDHSVYQWTGTMNTNPGGGGSGGMGSKKYIVVYNLK